MIYLDNAATTIYKPPEVIAAVHEALTKCSFNPGRGKFREQLLLEQKIYQTRLFAAALVGAKNSQTVFCGNCTAALNLAILGTVKRKGHVIVTATEHNSVLRPVMQLKKGGFVDVTVVCPDENGEVSPQKMLSALRENTYLAIVSQVSNVTGKMQDVGEIFRAIKNCRPDILTLCDAAQGVGYLLTNADECKIDAVAFSAHKGLHGMQGLGALVFSAAMAPRPIVYGGTGTESNLLLQPNTVPEGLEAGTLNVPAILACRAAINFTVENFAKRRQKLRILYKRLLDGLKNIDGITIYSEPNDSGIAAFNVKNFDSAIVADYLAEKDVAVRAGLHCAPLMHKYLGTLQVGAVRASLSADNTEKEIDTLLNLLSDFAAKG